MKLSNTSLILIAVAVVALLFLLGNCSLSCKKSSEGYKRSCLANDCSGLQRSPVDFAFKHPRGWQHNPHYEANPADEHQPLEEGPVDFYPDARRMDANKGILFQQYRNDWGGCGKGGQFLINDEKTRFDLTNVGDQGARNQLDELYHVRFGKKGYSHTERRYDEPNPFFDKLYGGSKYLVNDRLGD